MEILHGHTEKLSPGIGIRLLCLSNGQKSLFGNSQIYKMPEIQNLSSHIPLKAGELNLLCFPTSALANFRAVHNFCLAFIFISQDGPKGRCEPYGCLNMSKPTMLNGHLSYK